MPHVYGLRVGLHERDKTANAKYTETAKKGYYQALHRGAYQRLRRLPLPARDATAVAASTAIRM